MTVDFLFSDSMLRGESRLQLEFPDRYIPLSNGDPAPRRPMMMMMMIYSFKFYRRFLRTDGRAPTRSCEEVRLARQLPERSP
jgi:hypothetical protein